VKQVLLDWKVVFDSVFKASILFNSSKIFSATLQGKQNISFYFDSIFSSEISMYFSKCWSNEFKQAYYRLIQSIFYHSTSINLTIVKFVCSCEINVIDLCGWIRFSFDRCMSKLIFFGLWLSINDVTYLNIDPSQYTRLSFMATAMLSQSP